MDTLEEEKNLYSCAEDDSDVDGIKPPPGFIYDSFTDPDWRRPRRDNILPTTSFRARFGGRRSNILFNNRSYPVDWRNAKVAAKHLKFLPR